MNKTWQKYLDQNVPRYTSYPSALTFSSAFGPSHYLAALDRIGDFEPYSLYIHIPYCRQRCWYCGCNMRVENKYDRTAPYIEALLSEIAHAAAALAGRGRLTQIHFGGGTPNYLQTEDLRRIIDTIEDCFGLTDTTPLAMELDPRLCDQQQIRDLKAMGLTRASLGVQDFDLGVQAAINRIQPFEMVEACVSALREAQVEDVSFDLLYGLPKQSFETFQDSINKAIALNPDRISLFGYAHMPQNLVHQRVIQDEDLPSRSMRAALAEMADKTFLRAGYQAIGFDHYARCPTPIAHATQRGQLNRNFQGYTEDPADIVIGLGVSAISSLPGLYVQNAKDVGGYISSIKRDGLAAVRGVVVSQLQADIGEWIKRLLCDRRASLSAYDEIMAPTHQQRDLLFSNLAQMEDDKVVAIEGDTLVVLADAKPLLRSVAALFDPDVPPFSGQEGARLPSEAGADSQRGFASPAI